MTPALAGLTALVCRPDDGLERGVLIQTFEPIRILKPSIKYGE